MCLSIFSMKKHRLSFHFRCKVSTNNINMQIYAISNFGLGVLNFIKIIHKKSLDFNQIKALYSFFYLNNYGLLYFAT